jgi:hypothetical protein
VSASETGPTDVEVLRFEDLPPGEMASRRAVVRWSDGTVGEGLRWYADLCGSPHKSAYDEAGVMPRSWFDRRSYAVSRSDTSA